MTDLREQIAASFAEHCADCVAEQPHYEMADAILELLKGAVKPLEWEQRRAHKLGAGPYEVACNGNYTDPDAMWRVRFHGKVICKQIKGVDRATKWANDHHRARSLAALGVK